MRNLVRGRPSTSVLGIVGTLTLFRLVLAPLFGLLPQDYYYTIYAEHPALSYYDHPPMIGYLLAASTALLGKSALGVRLGLVLTTLGTLFTFDRLARRFVDETHRRRTVTLLAGTGMVTLLSLVSTPDVPMLLFWTLSLLSLERAVFADGRLWWLAAGLAMGLALDSKLTALALQAGILLFLVVSTRHRPLLRSPRPWVALAVAHLVALPVYVWNLRHDFASVLFQSVGRADNFDVEPTDTLGFVATQLAILLPVPFILLAHLTGREIVRLGEPRDERRLFLLCFFLPLLVACLVVSPFTWVKLNWAMPAYVAGFLLVAPRLTSGHVRHHLVWSTLLHVIIAIEVLLYPVRVQSDDTWFGWSELAAAVEERANRRDADLVFSLDNYKTAAALRFHTELPVLGQNAVGWNGRQLDYVPPRPESFAGAEALWVASEPGLRPSAETARQLDRVEEYCRGVEELEPIEIRHRGELARLFRVFRCRDYRPPR